MFRNNLFIKICLSFWLTTLFMIGGVVTVDWLTESGPFRSGRPPFHGNPLAVHGRTLVWIYEHEGAAALREFAAHLRAETGIRAGFFDEKGTDLLGPGGVASAAMSPADFPNSAGDGRWQRLAVAGKGGRTYSVVAQMPPRPPPPGGHDPWAMTMVRLLVVLTVSGLICYLLARYLTAPILRLGVAARRLAAGDLSVRVSPTLGHRNDEISRLAFDFDRMAERIDWLLKSQRLLLRDISHELRSPLARLNVALELCRGGADGEVRKSLDRIERESGRINEMIGHLLTLNRVESGISVIKKKPIDLAALIREITADAEFEARALNRGVRVTAAEACVVEGDGELLRRAIENVMRNAIRYTEQGSNVEVSLRCEGEAGARGVIAIRDHGRGVPEGSLPHLFKPFYRVGDGRERESGGTGLGLAITEAAVRLHGGAVRAVNASGGGLSVEISLPLHGNSTKPAERGRIPDIGR